MVQNNRVNDLLTFACAYHCIVNKYEMQEFASITMKSTRIPFAKIAVILVIVFMFSPLKRIQIDYVSLTAICMQNIYVFITSLNLMGKKIQSVFFSGLKPIAFFV